MARLTAYSQHNLRGQDFIRELIGHTNLKVSDIVYDIGAGTGAITAALASKVLHVYAIEFEPIAAAKLRKNMRGYENVTVKDGNFLEMKLPNGGYKIFANIPFHLSSLIVHKITEDKNPPSTAYLIVQKQFANKLLPNYDGFTGALGMMIGPTFGVRIRRPLKRSDYTPPPAVDTVLIEIKKREEPFIPLHQMASYRTFIERCFADPEFFAKTPQAKIGLRKGIKPSEMKLDQWVQLFNR
ncbi:MAG: methyltransferase domain-containing protein [Candidatus Microsaccharimonas sossegonensis]|uniref:Methyltransferase domain-containing protein n=1 Tax=Candidatus Microsaccharimonas sossegonensis TaxID=2506948 RepID=A0A4Q0AIB1_9BACT|nr:MAG: methyltransferase domain-containing protein [Candidatus Microsaccharimonas sossegonensis]